MSDGLRRRPRRHGTVDFPTEATRFYTPLSFSFHSSNVHSLDTEWLLSTLFDASLFMTLSRPEMAAPFLCVDLAFPTQARRLARRPPNRRQRPDGKPQR